MTRKPRLLDLFCGQGGAAMGYYRAGFEIVGVDNRPQPNYPFTFYCTDAISFAEQFAGDFDLIHASPPCQAHSTMTHAAAKQRHIDLIPDTREVLRHSAAYVIENVEGARTALKNPVKLCGSMFNLQVQRHRLFETSFAMKAPCPCDHTKGRIVWGVYGHPESKEYRRPTGERRGMKAHGPAHASTVLGGVGWMDWHGMTQCIPPAYTEYIGAYWKGIAL